MPVWPGDAAGASELQEAMSHLLYGNSQSLMLELAEHALSPRTLDIICGDLQIFPSQRKVKKDKKEISLTPTEFDILLFLARNRGEVFTKEQIYHAVWDGEYLMDDSNIMAFIRKLRKKIETHPDSPEYILTIWGIGYKFSDKLE
ncbi:MAG: winged helix-turn-helix domain-containing protein [Clostridiales bacterium]|nr:winged helix-turn-helix domain-containing protein [Clostridiales bacterium]